MFTFPFIWQGCFKASVTSLSLSLTVSGPDCYRSTALFCCSGTVYLVQLHEPWAKLSPCLSGWENRWDFFFFLGYLKGNPFFKFHIELRCVLLKRDWNEGLSLQRGQKMLHGNGFIDRCHFPRVTLLTSPQFKSCRGFHPLVQCGGLWEIIDSKSSALTERATHVFTHTSHLGVLHWFMYF